MIKWSNITLLAATTLTAATTLQGPTLSLGEFDEVRVYVNVSSTAGTPSATPILQGKDPDGNAVNLVSMSTVAATGVSTTALANFGDRITTQVVLGGTSPTMTIAIKAVGKTYG